ncbi:EAL and HDOD domain-containing protein [Chrysiogenes arsenatis]|uniref:EAL and HDOD domain-containing protein n=1 Tax=Chrysiogenes arsenatis TaxID=309797 RepID=UPI0003FB430B|nr:EAL domain-containing protein [Chrysiogenes arsenatis]
MDDHLYLGIQQIVDRQQDVYGYELLFRSTENNAAGEIWDDLAATARVLVNSIVNLGMQETIGDKVGFINVNHEVLAEGCVEILPHDQFILEILENTPMTSMTADLVRQYADAGFSFALDDCILEDDFHERFAPVMGHLSIIKVDVRKNTREQLIAGIPKLKTLGFKVLAEKIETHEEFDFCAGLGCDYFQGYFIARPTVLQAGGIEPAKLDLIRILKELAEDIDIRKLEKFFVTSPELNYSLLRFINSAVFSIRQNISSIRQALALIGRKQLASWLMLMLHAGPKKLYKDVHPVLQICLMRARCMELLAGNISGKRLPGVAEKAFFAGFLSLADVILGHSLEKIFQSISIDKEIESAVLKRDGVIGKLLDLNEALEEERLDVVRTLSADLGLNPEAINRVQLESFIWARNLQQNASKPRM